MNKIIPIIILTLGTSVLSSTVAIMAVQINDPYILTIEECVNSRVEQPALNYKDLNYGEVELPPHSPLEGENEPVSEVRGESIIIEESVGGISTTELLEETNKYRLENNLTQLVLNTQLTQAAQLKAQDMADKGYFSHTGPNGEKPWTWLQEAGVNYSYAGENLAINFRNSNNVVKAWVNSPKHRENLVNSTFTEVGFGIAEGFYQGRKTVFVVQFFIKSVNNQ
jgi:uncharacterized protein YkwD